MVFLVLNPEDQRMEYLEGAISLLSYLTYYQDEISQELWQFFPCLYLAFADFAPDYIEEMSFPLENYMCKDTEVFLEGFIMTAPDDDEEENSDNEVKLRFVDMIFKMAHSTFTENHFTEDESTAACQMLLSCVHNCMGRLHIELEEEEENCGEEDEESENNKNVLTGYQDLETIFDLVLLRLDLANTIPFKFKLYQVTLSLFIYDTEGFCDDFLF